MQEVERCHLDQLAQRIRAMEAAGGAGSPRAERVATGWPAVDAALGGGLMAGAVHEWVAAADEGAARGNESRKYLPPLALLMHLARRTMGGRASEKQGQWAVWVGRSCFAHPHGLAGEGEAVDEMVDEAADGAVLARTLWVDPPDQAGRLWAIDLAARCAGVAVVVADGHGLDMAETRRLQLAAEAGTTLVLLTRSAREHKTLSAATTRWAVRPAVSETSWPRWEVELLRCKGMQRGTGKEGRHVWLVEGKRERGQGLVVIPAEPGDRSAATPMQASAPRRQRA